MSISGTVVVLDADGVAVYATVEVRDEDISALVYAQKNKKWGAYPFPKIIVLDNNSIAEQVEANKYKDMNGNFYVIAI